MIGIQQETIHDEVQESTFLATARVLKSEFRKELLILWTYKFNVLVAQTFILGLIFVGAAFVLGNGQFHSEQLAPILLGYLIWIAARIIINYTYESFTTETQSGTLEQMYMSTAPSELIVLTRMVAILIAPIIVMTLTAIVLVLLLNIRFPLRWEGLPVILLAVVGIFGFGLMLGGAVLLFKQIASLADLIQQVFLFLSGVLIPVDRFPGWLAFIAHLMPITQGAIVLRQVVLQGQSLGDVWASGSLIQLIINSAAYLLIGWFIFKWCERIAKEQGSLGHY